MVYENIRQICKKKGISIRSVEKDSGLSNGVISKWKYSSPKIDNLLAVAKALNVPAAFLLEGDKGR